MDLCKSGYPQNLCKQFKERPDTGTLGPSVYMLSKCLPAMPPPCPARSKKKLCHMGLLRVTCVSSGVQYTLVHPGRSRVVWGFGAPGESLGVLGATDWVLHMHWHAR